jgi:hypothetical protein
MEKKASANSEFRSRSLFLFGGPSGYFDAFVSPESSDTSLTPVLLAFKENLHSAILVGDMPYQLTAASVTSQRFNQIYSSERIRQLKYITDDKDAEQNALADKNALAIARERMTEEMDLDETKTLHAKRTLQILDEHLRDAPFLDSANELLRQVLVMSWTAFEILVNDSFRLVLNNRPALLARIMEGKQFKDLMIGRNFILDALAKHDFNLSHVMGDLFCDVAKLDSLEKIRSAVEYTFRDEALDDALKSRKLRAIAEQRHLIVHRRGIKDARFLARTDDKGVIGERITFNSAYVESQMEVVRDVGLQFYRACIALVSGSEGQDEPTTNAIEQSS